MTSPFRPLALFLKRVSLGDPPAPGWVEGGSCRPQEESYRATAVLRDCRWPSLPRYCVDMGAEVLKPSSVPGTSVGDRGRPRTLAALA